MKLAKSIGITIFSLFLTSCMYGNPRAISKLPASSFSSKDSGVVIVSTGAKEKCFMSYTTASAYRRETKKYASYLMINYKNYPSDSEQYYGRVNAFILSPGRYYLAPVTMKIIPLFITLHVPYPDNFEFEVKAGETVYIGELYMNNTCGDPTQLEVRDQYERDIAVAKEKNKSLTHSPGKRLMRIIDPGIRQDN